MATSEHGQLASASEAAPPAWQPAGRGRYGTWAISTSAPTIRASRPISAASDRAATELEARLQGPAAPSSTATGWPTMIERYEAIEDGTGRVFSFAQLLFAANRDDPERRPVLPGHPGAHHHDRHQAAVRHPGAEQARGCAAGGPDRDLAASRALPALARHGAQLSPAPALRRGRADAAREICHRPQRLGPPVRRDHGGLALPAEGKELTSAEIFDLLSAKDRAVRERRSHGDQCRAGQECPAVRADHEHARSRTSISRTSGAASSARSPRATSPTRSRTRWSGR